MKLKLMSQNLHCYAEEDVTNKQNIIVSEIIKRDIDIVFLQEVAQLETNDNKSNNMTSLDNYGLILKNLLAERNHKYYLYFEPIKASFGIYQEGVAILSKYPLRNKVSEYISKTTDYSNWKSRKLLAYELSIENKKIQLATTHFGWSDGFECFEEQFDNAVKHCNQDSIVILAGDFNIKSDSSEYKYIINSGWYDLFAMSDKYSVLPTFRGDLDSGNEPIRIDYFMTNRPVKLIDLDILFIDERVSDHFGLFAEIEI